MINPKINKSINQFFIFNIPLGSFIAFVRIPLAKLFEESSHPYNSKPCKASGPKLQEKDTPVHPSRFKLYQQCGTLPIHEAWKSSIYCYLNLHNFYCYHQLSLQLQSKKHKHFKTPSMSVSNMCLCMTHWGYSCMRVLIVLEVKKYLFI